MVNCYLRLQKVLTVLQSNLLFVELFVEDESANRFTHMLNYKTSVTLIYKWYGIIVTEHKVCYLFVIVIFLQSSNVHLIEIKHKMKTRTHPQLVAKTIKYESKWRS